jgi:hypothetical protein
MDFPARFDFSTALRETDRILHPDGAGDVSKQPAVATGGIFGDLYTHHNPYRSHIHILYIYTNES